MPTLRVWAPTATSVKLHLFDDSNPATTDTVYTMTDDPATGVWSVTGAAGWYGKYYLYEVDVFVRSTGKVETNLVTDPYSVSLSRNSQRSQIVDLADATYKPAGWDGLVKPRLDAPEDIVLYELHVRDFSANDPTVPTVLKGTFKAFTLPLSAGSLHLRSLALAGLTHVHLLPAFDISSIDEDKSHWRQPAGDLSSFPADSQEQQSRVLAVAGNDPFNWGYDPFHYTVPEGSYSTNPDGPTRILEFRQMVKALGDSGLRTVMDVVYNHTSAAGQNDHSVLDRIVPGYYHRLNGDGNIETSTCCQNTASEFNMMEKLLIDSVVTWARQYKVDGFRFDLMGHHMKRNLVKLRSTLDALTLAADGVDGTKIYLYGEGWNFGEVANNARGVNATQGNMAGTGVGTFSDRIRDGARGGGPFSGLQEQGFLTGLCYSPNGHDPNAINQGSPADQLAKLLQKTDWIRTGLAGSLADYQLVDRTGNLVAARQIDYNGQPAGYTADPQEAISYIEAHDNDTLWDAIQAKASPADNLADRVRMQNLGISLLGFGQGIPFYHAGVELLRSKSMDRNSYNSGDWFNKLDFTYNSNNWGVGLPPAPDNQTNWPIQGPLLANPALKAGRPQILAAYTHFLETVAIRKSTGLFRLRTAADVENRLHYLQHRPEPDPGADRDEPRGQRRRRRPRPQPRGGGLQRHEPDAELQRRRLPGRAADPAPPPEALDRLRRARLELQPHRRRLLHPRPHRRRLLGQPSGRQPDPAPDPGRQQPGHRRIAHQRPRQRPHGQAQRGLAAGAGQQTDPRRRSARGFRGAGAGVRQPGLPAAGCRAGADHERVAGDCRAGRIAQEVSEGYQPPSPGRGAAACGPSAPTFSST